MLMHETNQRWKEFAFLILLFAIALAARLPLIDSHPPGLWYDEAIDGLDGLSLHQNPFQIFFTTEEHPREPMFMYIIGFVFLFLKPTVFTLRGTSALIGAAAVPALYLLLRIGVKNKRLALIGALLLLASRWHIHHSRLAHRGILLPLWMCLTICGMFWAARKNRFSAWILAGVILGLGFYTHLSFRLAPAILAVPLIWFWRRREIKMGQAFAFIAAASIVFLPLGIDYLRNPFHFWGRMDQISPFEKGVGAGLRMIIHNIWMSLLMFNFHGDENPLLNIPGMPLLNPLGSLFFFWGIYLCAKRAMRDVFYLTLFPWIGLMLLNTILSPEAPHFGRSLGAFVPAVIFMAVGVAESFEWLQDFLRLKRAVIIITFILAAISAWDIYLYFGLYRGDPRLWHRTNAAWVDAAREIKNYELRIMNNKSGGGAKGAVFYLPKDIYYHASVRFITLDVPKGAMKPMEFPDALAGRKGELPRDHFLLATVFNNLYQILSVEIPNGEIWREFRAPEGNTWGIFYRVPQNSLLSQEKAAGLMKKYSFESYR